MEVPQSGTYKAVALPKPQTTVGRCFGVIDVGTVDMTYPPGSEPKSGRKVIILWELPKLLAVFSDEKGEQPFMVMEELKFSGHPESNFAKLISTWRGKALTEAEKLNFPIEKMLNKTCTLSIEHRTKKNYRGQDLIEINNQNTTLVLGSISPLMEDLKATMPAMMNEPILWLWEDITKQGKPFDKEAFGKIYKFIRKKIYTSDEFKACPTAVNIDNEQAQASQSSGTASNHQQPAQDDNVGGDDW